MTKRQNKYEIKEAVRGSFVGARGRVRYDLGAGTVYEKDVDPEVLAHLLAAGSAFDSTPPWPPVTPEGPALPALPEGSTPPWLPGTPEGPAIPEASEQTDEPAPGDEPAESEGESE